MVVTRGHANDRLCAETLLRRPYLYLGMIGSKGKVAKTFEIMKEEGYSEEQISTIHAPIGLKIGARTPEEIAISIAAEMIAIKNHETESTMSKELFETKESGVLCIITKKSGSFPTRCWKYDACHKRWNYWKYWWRKLRKNCYGRSTIDERDHKEKI